MDDTIDEMIHHANAAKASADSFSKSIDNAVAQKTELLETHRKRLHILTIKAAKYGLECPASVELEILELENKIKSLGDEIEEVTGARKRLLEAINRITEILPEEKERMQAAAKRRKVKLKRLEKKRLAYGDDCPSELLKQIEQDRWFIETVERYY